MDTSHFFAYLNRMKLIHRWGLMRSRTPENIQEHTLQVAMIAHALALIENRRFGGTYDPEHAAVLALYHEVSEIFTGDMPTPVKYFNDEIRDVYHRIEEAAVTRLLDTLPEDLKWDYAAYVLPDKEDPHMVLVKAADTLGAFLKCVEERADGNPEFNEAYATIERKLKAIPLPSVPVFLSLFVPSFEMTLDEMNQKATKKDT